MSLTPPATAGLLLGLLLAGCGVQADPPAKPTHTDMLCAEYGGVASATYFSVTVYGEKHRVYISVDCKDGSTVSRTTTEIKR